MISEQKNNYEAIFLYTESDTDVKAKEVIYIRDKAIEENIPVFYLGDDAEDVRRIMPEHVLKSVFKRPIDVKVTAKIVDEYIKDYGKQVKKKVLVVDDSGAMLRNVKGWLGEKYNVILANSGTMAIKYLATDRPDLVLLDYEMPVIDGRQVLEMIRTENEFRDIPVIFLTSKNDRESILKVMELKPEGYLLKTMEPERIVEEVDKFFMKQKVDNSFK
jgi:CheY-like chemotaxis protein